MCGGVLSNMFVAASCCCRLLQAVNVASTIVAILLVDRLGRRFLFIEGGVQMILCEVSNGYANTPTPENLMLSACGCSRRRLNCC